MNEKFSDELLSAFVDEELSQDQRAEVERLLQSSPKAQQQLADFRKLSQLMHEMPQPPLPQDFADQVMRQAERHSLLPKPAKAPKVTASRAWWKPTLAVAAAAAAVVFFVQTVPFDDNEIDNVQPEVAQTEIAKESGILSFDVPLTANENHKANLSINRMEGSAGTNEVSLDREPSDSLNVSEKPARVELRDLSASPAPSEMPAEAELELKISPEVNLTRKKVGDVIEGMTFDESQEKVAVIKLVVVDVQEWVGGIEVMLQQAPSKNREQMDSDVVAVYLDNTTPEQLIDFVAELDSEGQKLIDIEEGDSIAMAELPSETQQFFTAQPGSKNDGNPNVLATERSRLNTSLTDKQKRDDVAEGESRIAETSPPSKERQQPSKKVGDDEKTEEKVAKLLPKLQTGTVPKSLQDQLKRVKRQEKLSPSQLSQQLAKIDRRRKSINKGAAHPLRVIFLVQQSPPPQPKKASSGGGGAA